MNSIQPVSTELKPRRRVATRSWRAAHWLIRGVSVAIIGVVGSMTLAARSDEAAEVESRELAPAALPPGLDRTDPDPPMTTGSVLMSEYPPRESADGSACPAGMIEVEGEYCPGVVHRCIQWISEQRDRCAKYQPTAHCVGQPEKRHFCIDQFEFPNREGQKPYVGMTWQDARDQCQAEGKRLCKDSEWTLACEGPERTPYPDGYVRGTCNVDQPYIMPDDQAFRNPVTRPEEILRLSQSEPSGVREDCVSYFGVYDMTGNVDEWVTNEHGSETERPYQSGLKGGYWGPVRNRCRPMTVDHNAWHAGYQIGFRCCADAPTGR